MSKVLIGLNTFNDLPYLKESLPAVEALRKKMKATVVIVDTAWNEEVKKFITKEYPDFDYFRHPDGNIGYGRSYNAILERAPDHDLYLVVTSDVLLHVPTVARFMKRMEEQKNLTMVAGKLYHWDLARHALTQTIDSLGIVGKKNHHFLDRGQGEEDEGQYDKDLAHFFGISGAVFLIRTSVIPKLHGAAHLLFDERFWMYKEDIDLSYRLRWLGEKITLFPEVWAWHARTVANRGGKNGQNLKGLIKADRQKKEYARLNSYKNHLLLLKNNFTLRFGFFVTLCVLIYEGMKAGFVFIRSPRIFFSGLKTLLFTRVQRSSKRVSAKKMLSYFS